MKVFLPLRGEFGWICMQHAPQVHAAIEPGVDMVCCEPGMEALYPGALGHWHVDRRPDVERRAAPERAFCDQVAEKMGVICDEEPEWVYPDQHAPRKRFVPEPTTPVGIRCGVVVCPRFRRYGTDKNWGHWQELIDWLCRYHQNVFAAGSEECSVDVDCREGAGRAWDFRRCLDASIEAMLAARLVIATDNGLAHLAVMCGRPLLLISHGPGLVADGVDDCGKAYWPIMLDRFMDANHCHAPIRIVRNAWHDPGVVVAAAQDMLNDLEEEARWENEK